MLIGYARVSTIGQSYESQKELLEEVGCEKIFVEKVTGTNITLRNELKAAIEHSRNGDTIIVTKIDRLARSIYDLNKIVIELKDKGVNIRFINDNMEFKANENNNSLQSLMFNILGSFAQFERDLIVERTTEGRDRAKAAGKHMGRKAGYSAKTMKKAIDQYNNRVVNGMSV